jgi:acyl dehydratase
MSDGFDFPVDRTAILNFASALGETNPVYYDEACARERGLGGVIAPPTFAQAASLWDPDHGLRGVRQIPPPRPREGPARGAAADVSRLLHGEQRFEYHKPLHPGTTLRVTRRPGRRWEKQGKRGGSMQFSETIAEYRDERGELVVTATSVAIITGQAVEA